MRVELRGVVIALLGVQALHDDGRMVAEFLGITEQFSDRVIFTNAAKLSDKAILRTRWVNAEVEAFRAGGRGDRVLCFVVAG